MINRNTTLDSNPIPVSGSPGFIGANLVMRLLRDLSSGHIISLDNMNNYYDVSLKEYRLAEIEKTAATCPVKHTFIKGNLADKTLINDIFTQYKPKIVVNLAAQAGVRYSISHSEAYIESNIIGLRYIMDCIKENIEI